MPALPLPNITGIWSGLGSGVSWYCCLFGINQQCGAVLSVQNAFGAAAFIDWTASEMSSVAISCGS